MIALRPHQVDALNNIVTAIDDGDGLAVGRVVMPTGAGKTFVEAAVLDFQRTKYSVNKIHLVLAPRILLTNQLIEQFRKYSGPTYRAIAFHSGNHEPDYEAGIKWNETATTRTSEVQAALENAIQSGQDLVVFSTYHSAFKLLNFDFDTVIADESQYCTNENFNATVKNVKARVKLFFTATEKYTSSNSGRGLNNKSVYGERLYYISPSELISLGLIVPPRLHIMYGDTPNEERTVVDEVIEIAQAQHKITVAEVGFSKILFAMKGTDDVKTVEDNITKLQENFPEHEIFTITSRNGARINNVQGKRDTFLAKLTSSKNCLIFHYDILSEGIDVDGITGVVLMRELGLSKLLQTIGRAVRVYKPNPTAKRWALVSVSVINGNEDDKENVRYYVNAIRDGGFDISLEQVVVTGTERHIAESEAVDDAYEPYKNNFAELFLTNVFHEIETDEFWKDIKQAPSVDEKFDLLFSKI